MFVRISNNWGLGLGCTNEKKNGSHLAIGVPPMARFNMYYRALDFQYTVEKGREKNSYRRVPLATKQKVRSFLIWSVWKWDFKKGMPLRTSKPHGSYNFNWNFLINSPKTDVNLLKERIWRIPDAPILRISKNDHYLMIGVPHRLHLY